LFRVFSSENPNLGVRSSTTIKTFARNQSSKSEYPPSQKGYGGQVEIRNKKQKYGGKHHVWSKTYFHGDIQEDTNKTCFSIFSYGIVFFWRERRK
jgi:hypothetical protein